jgi:membrane fusion protein (multidrug efflux system)
MAGNLKPMRKNTIISIVAVLAVIAFIATVILYRIGQFKKMGAEFEASSRNRAAVTVSTITAGEQVWRSSLNSVATLQSNAGILVCAELGGRVTRIAFESGANVKAGEILADLDTSIEDAQLKGLEAQAALAKISVARARELFKGNASAKADVDAAEAALIQADAAVEQMRATIAKKHITAPFAGRTGIRKVDLGQVLGAGQAIVALEATDPIYADFGVPQQEISRVRPGMTVRMTTDAIPGREFTGKIEAVEPRVSDSTRNVRVRAVFANDGETLRPGLFARVSVDQPETQKLIILPDAAITYNPYGDFVYVLREEKTPDGATRLIAYQEFVTVGQKRGSQVAILKGLTPGETVVTSGQIKLTNKAPAVINNDVVPSDNPAPKPTEG